MTDIKNQKNIDNENPYINQNKSENEKKQSDYKTKPAQEEKNEVNIHRRKSKILEYTSLVLAISSIASLVLIYCMTTEQNKISLESLKRADTSNLLTRESLEFTKMSTLSSDSATRKSLSFTRQSLNIAESSLTVSKKMLEVSEISMVATNTPYLQIRPKLGEIQKDYYGYIVMFRNVGNTPALSLRGIIGTEIAVRDNPNNPLDKNENFRMVSLPPRDSVFLSFDTVKVFQEEMRDMWMRIHTLRIYGFVEYEDIFGYKYRNEFSYYWHPDNDTFLIPKEGNSYKRLN